MEVDSDVLQIRDDVLVRQVRSIDFFVEDECTVPFVYPDECCRVVRESEVETTPDELRLLWDRVDFFPLLEYLSFHSLSPLTEGVYLVHSHILFFQTGHHFFILVSSHEPIVSEGRM